MGVWIRRIEVDGIAYTIRPSFIMPYMTGFTKDVEKVLFLRKFAVPYWALSYSFGRDAMYWYRMEASLGRNSLVGTTVRKPEDLPDNLVVDEKHTRLNGKKVYVATTVGESCFLGSSVVESAGEADLTTAYKIFQKESLELNPDYTPDTVNTDGWAATKKAWKNLFPLTTLITCFLHVFIKIRDRAKKKYRIEFEKVADKLWHCYRAGSKSSFSQRVRRLAEWVTNESMPDVISKPIVKMRKGLPSYASGYTNESCHRTSNMLDRLMGFMDRHLFNYRYFHGTCESANLGMRGWSLIYNFAPSNPQTVKIHGGMKSPAVRLNQFEYHDNWLQNLLCSASLGGRRGPPLNPI